MLKDSKIYVAGHNGLLGSALERELRKQGYWKLIARDSKALDLRNQDETELFFAEVRPEYVFDAAAKVGGIQANIAYPADFIYDNIQIQNNIINSSLKAGVKKLLFIGSNCIYPTAAPNPLKEEALLSGPPEKTNEAYAVAKIAGITMCKAYNAQHKTNFITAIPASMFGPRDHFNSKNSHFVPAVIRKFHEAKLNGEPQVSLFGTGAPRREMVYSDNVAQALIFLMENYNSPEPINVGCGFDRSIKEIADIVKEVVGYNGETLFDKSKPDGLYQKLLDSSKLESLGWITKTDFREELGKTYDWFIKNYRES